MRKAVATMAACMALLWVNTAQAVTAQQKCQQAKLKAQGKLQACWEKNAAHVLDGRADMATNCLLKFSAALHRADTAASAAGTSCRYVDNLDGTVIDLATGLVWEQKSPSGTGDVHDKDNLYTWSTGATLDGTVFSDFLYQLDGGTSLDGVSTSGCFAGHCDWRLPTTQELQSILLEPDPCSTSPCIDPAFVNTRSWYYWTVATLEGTPGNAWTVFFQNGIVSNGPKTNTASARAVCGGMLPPIMWLPDVGTAVQKKCQQYKIRAEGKLLKCLRYSAAGVVGGQADASGTCRAKFTAALQKDAGKSCRYVDNGDTVSDLDTGLVWEKKTTTVGSGADFADPHDVDNLYTLSTGTTLGTAFSDFLYQLDGGTSPDGNATTGCFSTYGQCEWRLPTVEELRGIVDCGGGPPCLDTAFGPARSALYWSSTTFAGFPYFAWFVNFNLGSAAYIDNVLTNYVRAVRGGL